mmetsp:Transcript_9865/g.16952  ORF Transcript_9865/g.16952 Transcript_9865/m.16952 type:complete len:206 (-) Transcript_9865:2-619(-)
MQRTSFLHRHGAVSAALQVDGFHLSGSATTDHAIAGHGGNFGLRATSADNHHNHYNGGDTNNTRNTTHDHDDQRRRFGAYSILLSVIRSIGLTRGTAAGRWNWSWRWAVCGGTRLTLSIGNRSRGGSRREISIRDWLLHKGARRQQDTIQHNRRSTILVGGSAHRNHAARACQHNAVRLTVNGRGLDITSVPTQGLNGKHGILSW